MVHQGRGGSPLVASLKAARSSAEVARLVEQLKPQTAQQFTTCLSAYGRVRDWRSAVGMLEQMRRCGVKPNVYSYSAAISACEKGGQWERALALLEELQRRGIEPTVISYSAAIQACAAAGQAIPALQLFDRLEASPLDAGIVSFNAILDALTSQPDRARALWKLGCSRGCYRGFERWGSSPALDLHDLSEGAAEAAVRWWLEEGVPSRVAGEPGAAPERLELITGWGKTRGVTDDGDVRGRVEAVLREMGATLLPTANPGRLAVDPERWLRSPES